MQRTTHHPSEREDPGEKPVNRAKNENRHNLNKKLGSGGRAREGEVFGGKRKKMFS